MRIKQLFKSFFLLFIFSARSVFSLADWTILIYVQAKNNLNRFAAQNLNALTKIGSSQNANILVQWYQPGQEGVWRYKILKNKIELDTYIPLETDGSNVKDLVDSMKWAVTKYPAKKNFLILWNHGVGILDPVWKRRGFGRGRELLADQDYVFDDLNSENTNFAEENPIKIDGILSEDFSFSSDFDPTNLRSRGILFNEYTRTYLNNQELLEALKQISTNVLCNKKIDILGMDACLMAMVEVGYLAKDFAKYMVGSQEVELAYGWDYLSWVPGILNSVVSPLNLAKTIVFTYENFYKNRIRFYTQSAIDLDHMDYIKDSINEIAYKVSECKKHDTKAIRELIKDARNASLQFSTRSYIDLYSFYSELSAKLVSYVKNPIVAKNTIFVQKLNELKKYLDAGKKLIEYAVVAKTAGPNLETAKGLSIYFPKGRIDDSYYKTTFAKESLWLELIKDIYI